MEEEIKKKKGKKKKNKQTKRIDDGKISNNFSTALEIGLNSNLPEKDNTEVKHPVKVNDGIEEVTRNDFMIEREVLLEEKINHLQSERDSYMTVVKNLKKEIESLEMGKISWDIKESSLEEKIKQLQGEQNSLLINESSLKEKIKLLEESINSLIVKEICYQEMIAKLNETEAGLLMQVEELEESKEILVRENQQLIKNSSDLQSQIQFFTEKRNLSIEEDTKASRDALLENLISENTSLINRVNELYTELGQYRIVAQNPIEDEIKTVAQTSTVDHLTDHGENKTLSGVKVDIPTSVDDEKAVYMQSQTIEISGESYEVDEMKEITGIPPKDGDIATIASGSNGEIVPIPLENEIQNFQLDSVDFNEDEAVPLSDAPMIGAPFRFFSFVVRYVSGADLVQNQSVPGR